MEVIKKEGSMKEESNAMDVNTKNAKTNNCTIPESAYYRRSCTLSDQMVKMLVLQMGHELENYTMYKTFAAYFYRNDLSKLGVYYDLRAREEDEHHEWIYNYLTECDADFSYPAVPAINIKINDHIEPFKLTVDREILTTLNIDQLVNQAASEGDWATFNFLQGEDKKTGKLVKEQREEESISRTIYGMAKLDVDWLKKQDSILNFYQNPDAE